MNPRVIVTLALAVCTGMSALAQSGRYNSFASVSSDSLQRASFAVSGLPKNTEAFGPAANVNSTLSEMIKNRVSGKLTLGISKEGRSIPAHYFPGKGERKALIIGGVHGSELSAIAIARTLLQDLEKEAGIYYNLVVVPCLFPDNEISALENPDVARKQYNKGRYTGKDAIDPNRQMPTPGSSFKAALPLDYLGRPIEVENQLLLQLIHEYQPDRIINLHAIRDSRNAGVFADPRTDYEGYALGYASDSSLAIEMAKYIYVNGGNVAGNHLDSIPTSLYYNDPKVVATGTFQPRNLEGAKLPNGRGHGISLGTWASTAVCDTVDRNLSRPAMRLITIEYPGYKRPEDYTNDEDREYNQMLIRLYVDAIKKIFLSPGFGESFTDPCSCMGLNSGTEKFLTDIH